ncbi:hypothetical protein [Vibrio rumoiensis]|uniref:YtxH domain-containing protein n=1 Tax=Vibrio rumoiensis 1S-45 TaxID=1188252 RepID=A0A1E5DZ54_9VIBR|nr:hypothetical protein [Vibrio rumoiensis]OEF23151.1 hypothetical protein A1QC_02790 [Vibrio rumoiensis 1S-45]
MGKLVFWIVLIAIGVGIGIKYQDPIMDALNLRDMEEVQDSLEDVTDKFQSNMDSLSDTVNQLGQN